MRKKQEISDAYNEYWDKVWWFRHQTLSSRRADLPDEAFTNAKKIEDKYGKENLPVTDYDIAQAEGKLSALSWVMGSEWNESLDT